MKQVSHRRSHYIIKSFEAEALRKRAPATKIADFFTSYFGTVGFLVANVVVYGIWMLGNSGKIPGFPQVDPFPYSFLNSFVSLEAIALSVIVLMSQNRENQRDVLRNELGLQVELISERELTKILRLLGEILEEKKKLKPDMELTEMIEDIDTGYIEKKLQEQMENEEKI